MRRGYKVITSTHSPQILELVWAIQSLNEASATPASLLKVFNLKSTEFFKSFAQTILNDKTFKTYYFSKEQNVDSVRSTSEIAECLTNGLQALGSNSRKIEVNSTRDLTGSVDIDSCVAAVYPNDYRWDYVFGYKDHIYYVGKLQLQKTVNIAGC